jgi:hypothetical protein
MAVTAEEARSPGMNVDDSLHYDKEDTGVLCIGGDEVQEPLVKVRRAVVI